jgi:hypothetical protein
VVVDLAWFKSVGLGAAQHAASVLLAGGLGDGANLWSLDYKQLGGLALGAAIASFLASVVAIPAPTVAKASYLSVPAGIAAAAHLGLADGLTAVDSEPDEAPEVYVHDVHGARGA